jgi:N-acetylneuraminic acid mutarotase
VQDGAFFIFSGVQWKADSNNQPQRIAPFLTDAYRYTPKKAISGTWQRIADVPRAVAAAPSPAMDLGKSQIVITGGIDHVRGDAEPSTHTGFDLDVFAYDSIANSWTTLERMPVGASRVNAPTTRWNGRYAIVAGERTPGRRSPNVYVVSPIASKVNTPAQ